ncbi:MAG: protein-disulfide reductase DsbD N-terminal domain-containing protein [Acidobacteriota bacterium]
MGRFLLIAIACTSFVCVAQAQQPLFQDHARPAARQQQVEFLYPEQITMPAGKPGSVELHFRVAPGLHINSHTPKDRFLIPTALSIPAGAGVRLAGATYPAGVEFTLPADPSTRLSVYTGEFAINAKLDVQPGDHLVQAKLHYQACDEAQCMPPRTATVAIDVIGK